MNTGWLTATLEIAGIAGGATVTSVEIGGDVGTGQAARNVRFHLTWDDPEGRPASVMGKFPSADAETRAQNFSTGSYIKEWIFYDCVAATVGVRVPQCYGTAFDAGTQAFVILMEDLVGTKQGDQIDGITPDQIALAVEQLVGLHAPRFGDESLQRILSTGQPSTTPEEAGALAQAFYGGVAPGFIERYGSNLDADVCALIQDFSLHVGRWFLGTDSPRTLVHLDYRADNLLFGQTADDPPIVVVDWQTAAFGQAGADLAYLLAGSTARPEERASLERDLVEEYRQRMAAAGIEISSDVCWRDYRFGSLWALVITVIASMLVEQTDRGDDMFVAMTQRHGRQALDLEALSLLR